MLKIPTETELKVEYISSMHREYKNLSCPFSEWLKIIAYQSAGVNLLEYKRKILLEK